MKNSAHSSIVPLNMRVIELASGEKTYWVWCPEREVWVTEIQDQEVTMTDPEYARSQRN